MKKKKAVSSAQEIRLPQAAVPAPAKPKAAKAPAKKVGIDYPQEGEIVRSDSYTVRIATTEKEGVQISVDGKEWRPCRESVGFWWFDWSGYNAGPHSLKARVPSGKRFVTSKVRQFTALI